MPAIIKTKNALKKSNLNIDSERIAPIENFACKIDLLTNTATAGRDTHNAARVFAAIKNLSLPKFFKPSCNKPAKI